MTVVHHMMHLEPGEPPRRRRLRKRCIAHEGKPDVARRKSALAEDVLPSGERQLFFAKELVPAPQALQRPDVHGRTIPAQKFDGVIVDARKFPSRAHGVARELRILKNNFHRAKSVLKKRRLNTSPAAARKLTPITPGVFRAYSASCWAASFVATQFDV